VKEKGSGKSAATTKITNAELSPSREAAGAIRRLVELGFSDQGPMAHIY